MSRAESRHWWLARWPSRRNPTADAEALAYRRLAAAILRRAALDARSTNGRAASARRWLVADPWAGDLLDALDLDPGWVRRWVDGLPELRQPALKL